MTQPLTVLIDPREAKDGVTIADLREQFQHNMRVRDMVTEVNQLVANVESARQRLQELQPAPPPTRSAGSMRSREKLVTPRSATASRSCRRTSSTCTPDDAGRPEDRPRRDRPAQDAARRARPASEEARALLGTRGSEHAIVWTGNYGKRV